MNEKQFRQKIHKLEKELKEKTLHSTDQIDSLQNQLKRLQKQFDQLTNEHSKAMEKLDRNKNQTNENEQHLQEDVQRLRRDLGLELYRKQDAEKKVRSLEDKLRQEQTQLQKVQYDYTQTKHDLKTLQVKYDALQLELIEIHKNVKQSSHLILPSLTANMIDDEPLQQQQRPVRAKRRTNDEFQHEPETKKPKRTTRSRSTASSNNNSFGTHEQETNQRPKRNGSTASTSKTIPIAIKQINKKSTENLYIQPPSETKSKPRTAIIRGRARKATNEPIPIEQQSPSHTYATIERDQSLDRASFATVAVSSTTALTTQIATSMETVTATPKQSTFKRIQSLFRPSPTLTSSARINRVLQTKSTVVAFGSSAPTQRIPPTVLKSTTPAPSAPSTPAPSIVKKIPSPKGKYNLRTRLFANPTYTDKDKDEDEVR